MRYGMIVFWTLLLSFMFIPSVEADSGQLYEVGADAVNVRIAPNHNAEIIGQIGSGDQLVVFQEQYGWVQTYYDGEKAWVASQFLLDHKEKSAAKDTSYSTVTITANNVRLRNGPGTDNDIIGHTFEGNTYEVIETAGRWHKLLLDNGSAAWVASWLTDHPQQQQSSSGEETSGTTVVPLDGYNIVLDPGHGGRDPGASGISHEQEKNFTLTVAKVVAQKLRNAGATVILTRSDDTYVSLEERVNISQAYRTDAFISLHYNAFPITTINGTSAHYYQMGKEYKLAQNIQSALDKHTELNSRGVKQDAYHVLRENEDVSVLVELGYITSPYDLPVIQTENHQSNVADAIVEGVQNYFHN
ncbi:N-acetylmuramoyl-L-alanine amidase [Lentibacillus halodurans]|nr:N-acetylmuramoyl-L-alanine amidase [Lentibacillus halodurans]